MRDLRLSALSTRSLSLLCALLVVAVDRLTKLWALDALADGPLEVVPGLLWLRLVENPGAAFGLLQGGGSLLALAAVVAAVLIALAIRRIDRPLEAVALGLVLGGAMGNLVDRLVRGPGLADGMVVDFIDLGWWPVFNVADAGITVGAVLLAAGALRRP